MSKAKITVLVIAAVMVVSGISMLIIGLTVGASPVISIGNRKAGSSNYKMVGETLELNDFDKADIDVASMDVMIESGSEYKLEYRTYEGHEPITEVKGGHLTLKQPRDSVGFNMDFRILSTQEGEYYKLTVPGEIKDLDLNVSSGDIIINGVNVSGKADLSSGDISIRDSEGRDLDIETSSGSISLEDAGYRKLKLHASSGDIKLNECSMDELESKTSSGEMLLEDILTDRVDLSSSSGDVTLSVKGSEDDYSYDIDTSSGSIRVGDRKLEGDYSFGDNKEKSIKAETSSGNVTISFK